MLLRLKFGLFLAIRLTVCFVCSKEPSHRDGSFEYPQHMVLMRNKKINLNRIPDNQTFWP